MNIYKILMAKIRDFVKIDDTNISQSTTYSSAKIQDLIDAVPAQDVIDDTQVSVNRTYSSAKFTEMIEELPAREVIDDTQSLSNKTYSSNKINSLISAIPSGVQIDDTAASATSVYSSQKVESIATGLNTDIVAAQNTANSKAAINDTAASATSVYSSQKVESITNNMTSINTFNLLAQSWQANADTSTNSDYPYIYTVSSALYNNNSSPLWQINGASSIITNAESIEAAKIALAYFDTTGIKLYATEQVTIDLVLAVKGVI